MAQRRHHYEQAFETYLRRSRIPYVAVDEAKKALLPRGMAIGNAGSALKSFDFVIYGQGGNLLVEVKGRRANGRRLECWVTREDVESLRRWEALFGPEFAAAFVFVYWHTDQPPDALFQEAFVHGERWYALRSILVRDYARGMRARSERWGTIDLPRRVFDASSTPFAADGLVGDAAPAVELLRA